MMNMDKDNNKGISRRSALKRMGLLVAGAACMGMPVLTACENKTKKRIILYFTGTGNCLYVARQLADEHTELLSIPQLVKQGRYTFEADEIGIPSTGTCRPIWCGSSSKRHTWKPDTSLPS